MNPFSNTKLFSVKELFPLLVNGKGNNNLLSDGDSVPYLGAKKDDNGVMRYCAYDSALIMKGNCICFICNGAGSVGYTLYMDRPFIATSDIVAGYNEKLNPYIAMYLISLFDLERPRFSYGRKWKKTLKDTTIPLPQTENGTVDWAAIDSYIKNSILPLLPTRAKTIWNRGPINKPIFQKKINLNDKIWRYFHIATLFNSFEKCKCSSASELLEDGNEIAYIGAKKSDNGVMKYVKREESLVTKGNCIVFIGDGQGSVGYCLYQPNDFIGSTTLVAGYIDNLNQYIAQFLVTVLDMERYRYSFGRKYNKSAIINSKIKLPIDDKGKPDWQFMENYIKSLPFSSNI